MSRPSTHNHTHVDADLEKRILDFQNKIVAWATAHELWMDSGFMNWIEHTQTEPEIDPCVFMMYSEGPLRGILCCEWTGDLLNEFETLVYDNGFRYEMWDNVSAVFYAHDDALNLRFREYFEWKWICRLVAADYGDLYEEMFEYFQKRPDRLQSLHHRDFEKLLDAIFRNNGYESSLGPGKGDGGVDLRLYRKDAIGDIVTLVQAKRYINPIKLEAVSALYGVVEAEKANRGLFVTTSRYLPSAKDFALRQSQRIKLATSADIAEWSSQAATRIIRDKSALVNDVHILAILNEVSSLERFDRVVWTSYGYNCRMIEFCLVLKETRNAALLMLLPNKAVSGDGQVGTVIPNVEQSSVTMRTVENVFRASRSVGSNSVDVRYWGNHKAYYPWNGEDISFNLMD